MNIIFICKVAFDWNLHTIRNILFICESDFHINLLPSQIVLLTVLPAPAVLCVQNVTDNIIWYQLTHPVQLCHA